MQLIKNKWFQWAVVFFLAFGVLPLTDASPTLLGAVMVWAICFPSMRMTNGIWKLLRFNYFPSPLQLLKGFKRIWPAVRKGPVVARVHRPRQSSRIP
jgi:hypothetical protein